jgi:LmbE family N-acetylglucosaminyl deacetylase
MTKPIMMRCLLVMLCAILGRPALAAAEPGAGGLAHAVDRLATTGRVLYVAAHPDDENTRLLAYLANVRHLDVGYLSMTRGGGGQNLIGGEQGVLLDVIRTEELLAARRIDGARQFFTRMRDFGYTKRADEALATWGHDEALADVVWVIRTFQPDVIITRFSERPSGGNHGHHTASAILAHEAFAAAADPKRFPEQLKNGVTVWQADRLLWNTGNFGGGPPQGALDLDIGVYDPRLGLSMGELAARSRSQHKSQGFGVPEDRGSLVDHFVVLEGHRPAQGAADPFGGIELTWKRYGAAATGYARAIADAQRTLDRDHPERALPALARARAELDRLPDDPRVRDTRRALDQTIADAAGFYARATSASPVAAPGTTVDVTVELVARAAPVIVQRIAERSEAAGGGGPAGSAGGAGGEAPRGSVASGAAAPGPVALAVGDKRPVKLAVPLPAQAPPSLAYWLARPPAPGHYAVADPALIGAPHEPAPLQVGLDVAVAGRTVHLVLPVVHAWTDRVLGERVRPLVVVPPATVTPLRDAVMAPGRKAPLALRVRAGRDAVTARIELELPAGWTAQPASQPVTLARLGDETTVQFDVAPGPGAAAGEARPVVRIGDASYSLREDVIDHPHIPVQVVLRPATVALVPLSIKLPAGRIAYVKGSGDSIAADLAHIGLAVDELDDDALRTGDLSRYTAVVLGIRAYNTRPAVRAAHPRLMAYAERGGTVVVQYNTLDFEGPIGPFPLELGRDRITDENAQVGFLDAKQPVLHVPNEITAADFTGWVQERGIYFGAKWDTRYTPILRFSDPGEGPLDGSLLVARHGKGSYIYTGLVFFRELPAGVPGAYRLFANLLAGGK